MHQLQTNSADYLFGIALMLTSVGLFFLAEMAGAAGSGNITKDYYTAELGVDYGQFVHKSDHTNGTDFASLYQVHLGLRGGKEKPIGMALNYDTLATDFSQNDSEMRSDWNDLNLDYQYKWVKVIAAVGFCRITSGGVPDERSGELDIFCQTAGGGLGLHVPLTKSSILFFELRHMTATISREEAGKDVSAGSRLDIDCGVEVGMPFSWMKIVPGYKLRRFTLNTASGSYSELQTGLSFGFILGLNI